MMRAPNTTPNQPPRAKLAPVLVRPTLARGEAQEATESPQAHEAREIDEHLSWWGRMFGG